MIDAADGQPLVGEVHRAQVAVRMIFLIAINTDKRITRHNRLHGRGVDLDHGELGTTEGFRDRELLNGLGFPLCGLLVQTGHGGDRHHTTARIHLAVRGRGLTEQRVRRHLGLVGIDVYRFHTLGQPIRIKTMAAVELQEPVRRDGAAAFRIRDAGLPDVKNFRKLHLSASTGRLFDPFKRLLKPFELRFVTSPFFLGHILLLMQIQ